MAKNIQKTASISKHELSFRKFAEITLTIRRLGLYGTIAFVAYLFSGPIEQITMNVENVTFGIGSVEVSVDAVVEWVELAALVILGRLYWRERALRRRNIAKTDEHVKALEHMVDPRRSTSGLTSNGMTNPSDLGE